MYSHLFELEEDVFKIIANQKRLEIIQLLSKKELNVSEMIDMLGLRQANLSQHLSLLRQHKIVSVRKFGREAYYKLADDNIAEAVKLIYIFLQKQYGIIELGNEDSIFPIVVDPVCTMRISESEAFDSIKYESSTHYFCASGCRDLFKRHPSKYVSQH